MAMLDVTKTARQEVGINKWRDNNGIGTLVWAMRFGKTRGGLMIVQRLVAKNKDATIIVVVPSEAIMENWNRNIRDMQITHYNIEVYTINQVLNFNEEKTCSLLILDEIHKYLSDLRYPLVEGKIIVAKFKLGLTGTFPIGEDGKKISKYYPPIDIITEREAVLNNWITNFIEFNYSLEFTEEDKEVYKRLSKPIGEVLSLFKGVSKNINDRVGKIMFKDDLDIIQSCIRGKKFPNGYSKASVVRDVVAKVNGWHINLPMNIEANKLIAEYWSPESIEKRTKYFEHFVRERTNLISNNKVKLETIVNIYRKFPNITICFNESIDFAEAICNRLALEGEGCVYYHSKIKSRPMEDVNGNLILQKNGKIKIFGQQSIKKEVIEGIRRGKYRFISTAKALDEGLDVPSIEQVITSAGSTNPIQYEQRNARAKTVDIYNPNKVARIINLYFDDFYTENGDVVKSRDKQKLMNRQKNNMNEIIYISSIDEIF